MLHTSLKGEVVKTEESGTTAEAGLSEEDLLMGPSALNDEAALNRERPSEIGGLKGEKRKNQSHDRRVISVTMMK